MSSAKARSDSFNLEAYKPVYIAIDAVKNRPQPLALTFFGIPRDAKTYIYISTSIQRPDEENNHGRFLD